MRDVNKKLPGEASHKGVGIENLKYFVFPIIKQLDSELLEFVGTGFFVANFGIVATATHVIKDALDSDGNQSNPLMIVHFVSQNEFLFRRIIKATHFKNGDVSLCLLDQYNDKKTGKLLQNNALTLTTRIPAVGEEILTYAYPNTVVDIDRIHSAPALYNGVITEYYPQGRDQVMMPKPCYQTSMIIHGGASGGPVFSTGGGVFGINSTGFENEEISFVSRIQELLLLSFPKGSILTLETPSDISVVELAKYGHARLVDY